MSELLTSLGLPMTELQVLSFVVLPAAIAIFAWAAVLIRERRLRVAVGQAKRRGR